MGLLDRFRDRGHAADEPRVRTLPNPGGTAVGDLPLKPEARRLGQEERDRIAAGLAALEADGVDVDDLASISAGFDRALTGWVSSGGTDHDAIVERYSIGIGEHLARRTDLSWQVVTDVFGTDLGLASGDFVVVPGNLVAVRWMRRETGWIPRVVGHLLNLRARRP
ncbi:hypothetical protein [Ornithinimicrobium tianjinense]|uniref:DUF3806 domain-containing protein n=1 Tax=Ornithinimicrobium tianjinense TaxID=1195761 RepID=A0A917F8X8_9MICO|nr:hypothetical protein [Ornithinimicrobium tianjinense]GGF54239.1 hypothetical protein GCM10011366_22610 [Ornithinimicrobium tianjinense]